MRSPAGKRNHSKLFFCFFNFFLRISRPFDITVYRFLRRNDPVVQDSLPADVFKDRLSDVMRGISRLPAPRRQLRPGAARGSGAIQKSHSGTVLPLCQGIPSTSAWNGRSLWHGFPPALFPICFVSNYILFLWLLEC